MKRLICEMCGSTDLLKEEGVFVCQTCGCKYSVEEAKKMMIEGVVEVSGTVKVDNSDNVEKLIVNADRAYDDSRYKEAEKIYSSVLEIDTENIWAIHRKGMSISLQGNIADGSIGIAGKTSIRAIDCLYEGEKEYSVDDRARLLTCIICEDWDLSEKIVIYALKEIQYALQKYGDIINELSAKVHSLPVDYLQEIKDRATNEKDRRIKQAKDLERLAINMIFAVFIDVIIQMENEDEEIAMLMFDLLQARLLPSVKTYSEVAPDMYSRYSQLLQDSKCKIEKIQNERKQKAIEEYWKEHAEEKKVLEEEKRTLLEELEELKNEETASWLEQEELEKEKRKAVPAEVERNNIQEEIDKLTLERKKLGLFKKKEKSILDQQIYELQRKLESFHNDIITQRNERDNNINAKLMEASKRNKSIENRIKDNIERQKNIEFELTKDRSQSSDE